MKQKILLLNFQYATGLDGSFTSYVLEGYKYLHNPKRASKKVIGKLTSFLEKDKIDICCFLEIKKNFFSSQEFKQYQCVDIENKYGPDTLLGKSPYFKQNCSGFISKNLVEFKKHFLARGMKRLFYEIQIQPRIKLLFGHFSLRRQARQRELGEIKKIVTRLKLAGNKIILCGDFNIFQGRNELVQFCQSTNLIISSSVPISTYPARKPKRELDLFIHSQELKILGLSVVKDPVMSDHLGLILELELK